MKKILSLVALVATLIPALSFAAPVRVEKVLRWKFTNSAVANGSYYVTDATNAVNVGCASCGPSNTAVPYDTTETFSMADLTINGSGFPNSSAVYGGLQDSLMVGALVVYRDSTAAGSPDMTSLTATIEGSHDLNSWASAGTFAGSATSGDPTLTIPIILRLSSAASLNLFASRLRIRFTAATGVLPAGRVKLVYWADDGRR